MEFRPLSSPTGLEFEEQDIDFRHIPGIETKMKCSHAFEIVAMDRHLSGCMALGPSIFKKTVVLDNNSHTDPSDNDRLESNHEINSNDRYGKKLNLSSSIIEDSDEEAFDEEYDEFTKYLSSHTPHTFA
ncbi:hypothetical protein CANTEDRAFT_133301 [Yamadazyma tenuis ATCC 10573]|uniref:Uncharacterized protein n=2 Tax=Candida tenuis TaxID=2315449 RepID=G3AYK7_CANTC|nr:uncharacterized protein CANTEDRAFT_133301 [Yamadazyma tenuis ATCC 10573]EGV65876.1 hypothetical protein CANTEDRAFT_133301 [Yamadazyma tenuis ATCC 10573]